jgi:hypothetical protein
MTLWSRQPTPRRPAPGWALPPGKSLTLRDRRTTWTRRTLPAFCAAGHLSKFRSWCKQIRLICRLGELVGVIKIPSGSLMFTGH